MNLLTPALYGTLYSDITTLRKTMVLPFGLHQPLSAAEQDHHSKIFRSEFNELCVARTRKDILDGLVDAVVTLIQPLAHQGLRGFDLALKEAPGPLFLINELLFQAHFLKMDFMGAWAEIQRSNLSKVCSTEQDLEKTQVYYSNLGVKTYNEATESGWVVKVAEEVTIGEQVYPKGKFLKSASYSKPDLAPFI